MEIFFIRAFQLNGNNSHNMLTLTKLNCIQTREEAKKIENEKLRWKKQIHFNPLEIYVILIFFYVLRTIYDRFFCIFANLVGV